MNHYFEIRMQPDPEIPVTVLMNAVYAKLHKALCDLNSTGIGVSFPNSQVTLGNTLRLHGSDKDLDDLLRLNWIGPMSGYCQISAIQSVPLGISYRSVSRKQSTMTQSKLNRLIKRGSISQEQVKEYRAKMFTKGLDNPYVELVSGSNGQKHRRYIEFGPLLDIPTEGAFDQFGLSKTATVPWF